MPTTVRSSAYLGAFTVLRPPYSNHSRVSVAKIGRAVAAFGSGVSSVRAGCCGMRPRCRPLCTQALICAHSQCFALHIPTIPVSLSPKLDGQWLLLGLECWSVQCDGRLLRYAAKMLTTVHSSAYLCAFTVLRPPYSNHSCVSVVKTDIRHLGMSSTACFIQCAAVCSTTLRIIGQLPTANCQLPTANYQLPTANCQLPTANCQLPTANCQLECTNLRFYQSACFFICMCLLAT
jgi:hypothetical protein